MIRDYLTGGDTLKDAGLQGVLVFEIKCEQQAVEFYSKMMGIMRDETTKRLYEKLVHEELKHKLRFEMFYDDFSIERAERLFGVKTGYMEMKGCQFHDWGKEVSS